MLMNLSDKIRINLHNFLIMAIIITGLTSVPLHVIYSPDPFVSMTKFTIQSNILVTIIFILTLFLSKSKYSILDLLKNSALVYMIIVMSIYHFVLSRGGEYNGLRTVTNFMLHYLIPVLVIVNWALFEEKNGIVTSLV